MPTVLNKPATPAQVAEAVRKLPRLLPRAGGSKPALSTPPSGVAALDLAALTGVLEYTPDEYTFTALAGTPMAEVQALLARHNQYFPFDPPFAARGATLSGALASGRSERLLRSSRASDRQKFVVVQRSMMSQSGLLATMQNLHDLFGCRGQSEIGQFLLDRADVTPFANDDAWCSADQFWLKREGSATVTGRDQFGLGTPLFEAGRSTAGHALEVSDRDASYFGDKIGDRREHVEPKPGAHAVARFQRQSDLVHRRISRPVSERVNRTVQSARSRFVGSQNVCGREPKVVVAMHLDRTGGKRFELPDKEAHRGWSASTTAIDQCEGIGTSLFGRDGCIAQLVKGHMRGFGHEKVYVGA